MIIMHNVRHKHAIMFQKYIAVPVYAMGFELRLDLHVITLYHSANSHWHHTVPDMSVDQFQHFSVNSHIAECHLAMRGLTQPTTMCVSITQLDSLATLWGQRG